LPISILAISKLFEALRIFNVSFKKLTGKVSGLWSVSKAIEFTEVFEDGIESI
jgi:hypothetical protein